MIHQRHADLLPFLPAALSYASYLLKDAAAAEDIVQDVTIHALQTNHFPVAEQALKPWLLRVVRNRCIDRIRGRRIEVDEQELLQLESLQVTPEQAFEQQQIQRYVLAAMGDLPTPQRELLILRELNDCSYAEIATITGVPVGTIMSSLHRARLALKTLIKQRMGDPV